MDLKQVDRLWNILQAARSSDSVPQATSQPDMKDSLYVQLLLEKANDRDRFIACARSNEALSAWAGEKSDEELSYYIWLHRSQMAA